MSAAPGNPSPPRPPARGLDLSALAAMVMADEPFHGPPPEIPGYRVQEWLGTGGSATVWKALHVADQTTVALKIPHGDHPLPAGRLLAEADSLRALRHPHILRFLHLGEQPGGRPWLALEYIAGAPLSVLIPAGGFDWAEALRLFRAIAAGIGYAHSRGLLHRDLKPANILLGDDGGVKVADFGLARPMAERIVTFSLTVSGNIAGTAEYLAPECYDRTGQPGAAADIYALGVILYELLAGHPPRGAWTPVSLRKRVDIRVDEALQRALAPDPAHRFPTVQAMLDEVNRIARTPPRYAGTPRLTRAVRFMDVLWTLIGLFLLLGSLGLIVRLEKIGIGVPLDLIGTESERMGTYQGVLLLLLAGVPAGLWQLARLHRFRKVPLREALPSPFGLKLGTSHLAALTVTLGQIVFFLIPALFGAYAWQQLCMTWLDETSVPWAGGFVLTSGIKGDVAYDRWSWPQPGQTYWLRDRFGWITDPLGRELDHNVYWPGMMPRLLTGLALFHAAVGVLTLLSAAARWWRFRKWRQGLALLVLFGCADRGRVALRNYFEDLALRDAQWDPVQWIIHRQFMGTIGLVVGVDVAPDIPAADKRPSSFAKNLRCGDQPPGAGDNPQAVFLHYARQFSSRHRDITRLSYGIGGDPQDPQRICGWMQAADLCDAPGGLSTGSCLLMVAYGRFMEPREVLLDRIDHRSHLLWTAQPRELPPAAANLWAETLLRTLASPAPADRPDPLADLFLPHLLHKSPTYSITPDPAILPPSNTVLISDLRAACARGARLRLLRPPGPAVHLPGALRRIVMELEDRSQPAAWTADLVFADERWQCARLAF